MLSRMFNAARLGSAPALKVFGVIAMAWWCYTMIREEEWLPLALALALFALLAFLLGSRKQVKKAVR
jgi:hypothetical protein